MPSFQIRFLLFVGASLLLASGSSFAQDSTHCKKGAFKGSEFYLPTESGLNDVKFKNDIRLWEAGLNKEGKLVNANGVKEAPCMAGPGIPSRRGGFRIDKGSSKPSQVSAPKCLVPYFSVAAAYPPGTILEIPAMKGKQIAMPPDGHMVTHPGYVTVDDDGGPAGIKDPGRIDFYTGTYAQKDPQNFFQKEKKLGLTGSGRCNEFNVIKQNSSEYKEAKLAMEQALSDQSTPKKPAKKSPSQR